MAASFRIKDQKDGKLIILNKAFGTRAQILNAFYALVFFAAGAFAWTIFGYNFSTGAMIFGMAFLIVCYIAAYRFINKAFVSERLVLNEEWLRIVRKGSFQSTGTAYEISKISALRHLEKPEITRHPLAGQSIDYLGFQTEQLVINEMHGDKRVAFDYEGKTISFGENIYSWDFEEINRLIIEITGRDLQAPAAPLPS